MYKLHVEKQLGSFNVCNSAEYEANAHNVHFREEQQREATMRRNWKNSSVPQIVPTCILVLT